MAANKILNCEPAYIATATLTSLGCNLLNSTVTTLTPGGVGFTGTQPYVILKHIRLMNTDTASTHTVTLYKGASATATPGTEFGEGKLSIAAQGFADWYGQARFDSADYLVGIADTAKVITINMDAEIGLS
jgi:hypothetical protein